jgi:heme exporter protein B
MANTLCLAVLFEPSKPHSLRCSYLRSVKAVYILFKKEFQLDMRKKQLLFGILLFVLSSVFTCYLSLEKIDDSKVLAALFWIVGLFAAFNAMQKSFQQEQNGTDKLLYTLASPRQVWIAKAAYYALLILVLNLLSILLFSLFFGPKVWSRASIDLLVFAVFLGSIGLGTALTFLSALSFKANGSSSLTVVLGFPVLMPFLFTLTSVTLNILDGATWQVASFGIMLLAGLFITTTVMALFLVPFFWKS